MIFNIIFTAKCLSARLRSEKARKVVIKAQLRCVKRRLLICFGTEYFIGFDIFMTSFQNLINCGMGSGNMTAAPCPLKIVAAAVAVNIEYFSGDIQAGALF